MREIKFRAWDYQKKRMIYFDNSDMWDTNWLNEPEIGMQYTGLKDKNGKEIYESDLIRHRYGIYKVRFFTDLCWDGGCPHPGFYLTKNNEDDFEEMDYHVNFDDIEIIGNIHENPELLEK